MDLVTSLADTFKLDFESAEFPGYVPLNEQTSFLYLTGLNRGEFRHSLDELLQNNPTGPLGDTTALMSQFQNWKVANSLSFPRNDTSNQGSALVTAIRPKNDPNAKTRHLHPTHCTWCLAADKVKRFGHISANCSKNHSRSPGDSIPQSTTTAQTPPTTQRLRPYLASKTKHSKQKHQIQP